MIKRLGRKLLSLGMIGVMLSSSLLGCGSNKKEELNILNWTEYLPEEVIQKFEEEYDVKINYNTYSSTGEMLSKVETAAPGTYDLIIGAGVKTLAEENLLVELDRSKIPNFDNISDVYLGQEFDPENKYSVPYSLAGATICYDSDVIKDEITSYKDLLDPKYKDSLILVDDSRAVIGMALLACGYSLNETDDAHLQEAKEFLLELKPNIKAFNSDSPKTSMITGETSLGVIYTAEATLAMREKNSIKVVYPDEGIYYGIDSFSITKDAKNEDLAYKFIDFVLRPEISKIVTENFPYKNPNKAAEDLLPEEYLTNPACNIPEEVLDKNDACVDVDAETLAKYDKIWSEFKSN